MKKDLSITAILAALVAVADDNVVTYGETTFGPSDTVVHYDTHDASGEKSTIGANHPGDKLYPVDEKK